MEKESIVCKSMLLAKVTKCLHQLELCLIDSSWHVAVKAKVSIACKPWGQELVRICLKVHLSALTSVVFKVETAAHFSQLCV